LWLLPLKCEEQVVLQFSPWQVAQCICEFLVTLSKKTASSRPFSNGPLPRTSRRRRVGARHLGAHAELFEGIGHAHAHAVHRFARFQWRPAAAGAHLQWNLGRARTAVAAGRRSAHSSVAGSCAVAAKARKVRKAAQSSATLTSHVRNQRLKGDGGSPHRGHDVDSRVREPGRSNRAQGGCSRVAAAAAARG